MTLLHLTACILAIAFTQDEWAILVEMLCLHSLDPTMSIEAVVYDFFKNQPGASRQATSTSLSTMTLTVALSTGLGGIIYDQWSWQGLAIAHTVFEGLLLVVLWLQKACWRSVEVVLLRRKSKMHSKKSKVSKVSKIGKEIQWALPATEGVHSEATPENREGASAPIPGHVEHEGFENGVGPGLALEDVEEEEAGPHPVVPTVRETVKSRRTKSDVLQEMLDELDDEEEEEERGKAQEPPRRTRFQDAETEPQDEVAEVVKPKSPEVDKQHSTAVSGRRTDHKLLDAYLQELEAEELDDHPDQFIICRGMEISHLTPLNATVKASGSETTSTERVCSRVVAYISEHALSADFG
ncbi:unnamed protein product [Cladocopium goreaui]|uniref:Uncharacterized protein n=1 Tax=Cladocopium goreaui TaxID=2562237 RepID=A0A9P1GSG6_9DINO|nr:unnamed protein product [Cladocopium goreaui]